MKIKDSGQRTDFGTGAVRDMHTGKGRMDLLPWEAIMEVSKHCEEGALKYGERNVDKGIPVHSFLDSGFRHLAKYMEGWTDEPHLRAAAWNIIWAIQTLHDHPDLQDIPKQMVEDVEVPKEFVLKEINNYDDLPPVHQKAVRAILERQNAEIARGFCRCDEDWSEGK